MEQPANNYKQSYNPASPRYRGWAWLLSAVILLGVSGSFVFAVYGEVVRRNQAVREIVEQTKKPEDILNNPIISQLKQEIPAEGVATTSVANAQESVQEKSKERQMIERMDRPSIGNASSSIVIVQFGDFECPVCLEAYPVFRTLTNKYGNEILFIFRSYPVKNDNSAMMAQAAFCANDQGKFWQLHDRFFMNFGKMSSSEDLKKVILSAGLNWQKMQDCMSKEKYRDAVLVDMSDALDLGVRGTPTFFINGSKLEGAVTLENWEKVIDKAKELNQKL